MVKHIVVIFFLFVYSYVDSCLITNCPRGGKRSGTTGYMESNIKKCISCGPGYTGQCFGPNICCGPFGCLMGTPETVRCQREGMFHEAEACIAGKGFCRKNTGRCATENICCNQDSCITDRHCSMENKQENIANLDFYNFLNTYPIEITEN
ncbi:neurophysin 1-like [Diorhabda carinulata]|uniref:neurophysin 1-like n=1 Tax=Diorhabda sublineata TaxID=1163346 RepID=UPI0024E196C4|nr:neurophysin 1-like [Diorhabda sublineata]XP_057652534.1 neurophysin 1-like [Diorhabda carinulata]